MTQTVSLMLDQAAFGNYPETAFWEVTEQTPDEWSANPKLEAARYWRNIAITLIGRVGQPLISLNQPRQRLPHPSSFEGWE